MTDQPLLPPPSPAPGFRGLLPGLAYCFIGSLLFWCYLFTLCPLISASQDFSDFKRREEQRASLRDAVKAVKGEVSDPTNSLIAAIGKLTGSVFPGLTLGGLLDAGLGQTKLEQYALEGKSLAASARNSSKPPDAPAQPGAAAETPAAKGTAASAPKPNDVADKFEPSWTFVAWMRNENYEHIYDNWIVRMWAALPANQIALRAFVVFSLALGLLFGGVRMLVAVVSHQYEGGPKAMLLPWVTPLVTLMVLILLSGFGPLFSQGVDSTTSRMLAILTAAVAISPEDFVMAWWGYLSGLIRNGRFAKRLIDS